MSLQPAQQSLKKFYPVPTLGFNNRFDPTLLKDNEGSELLNLQVNQDGTLAKYPGYSKNGSPFPNSTDSFIRMLHNLKRGASVDTLLIAARDNGNTNATYKVDVKSTIGDGNYTYIGHTRHTATFTNGSATVTGVSTTWSSELKAGDKIKNAVDSDSSYVEISNVGSNTSLTLTTTYGGTSGTSTAYVARKIWNINGMPRATTFDNFAVITNGIDVPQVWDNTSLDSITDSDAPKAKYLEVHKNRLFMANASGSPSTLYWSATNDPQTWDPVSTEDVSVQDGGDIVSIKSFSNSLIVFKSNGTIHQVIGNFEQDAQGSADFVKELDSWENIGIIAERSPVVHNNSLYFMCETGVYRIDPRMYIEKVSYLIDPFTNTVNFALAGAVNKSFSEVSKSQWDSGTHDGTWTDSNGTFQTFFDEYSQTDAHQEYNQCSISIGSDNTLHVAYVPVSNDHQINYVRYRPGGTALLGNVIQKETSIITTDRGVIQCLSVAVDNSTSKVGIVYGVASSGNVLYIERSADTQSPSFSYGTWNSDIVTGIGSARPMVNMRLIYIGSQQNVVWNSFNGSIPSVNVGYGVKSAGVWSGADFYADTSDSPSVKSLKSNIAVDNSNNLYVSAFTTVDTELRAFKSTDGGANWISLDVFTLSTAQDDRCELSVGFNNAGDFISVFSDRNGAIRRRNHVAATTTTINTTSGCYSGGWFPFYNTIDAANRDTENYLKISSANTDSYTTNYNSVAVTGNTITNTTTGAVKNSGSGSDGEYRPSPGALTTNGRVVAVIYFGTNTNEVVIKRLAPFSKYVGHEFSDSTLSAWGTFVVTGEVDNSNTVTHAIALGSVAHPSTFNTIISGTTISSNTSLVFIINRVISELSTWSGISIQSIVMNYQGAGVDAKQVVGQEFFNELYFSVCETGNSTNNKVLVYDIANTPLKTTYVVSAMARYKTNLWAGSATNGDLYILKQGYDYNGSPYSSDFISREDFLEFMERDKEIYKAFVVFKTQTSGSFTFSYRFNNFLYTSGATWNTVTIDQTQSNVVGLSELSGKPFRSFQFRIQDSNTGVPISVIGLTLMYGILAMRDQ